MGEVSRKVDGADLRRMTAVKICCIASVEEARLAVDRGAAAIGLVGRMPSGPGPIDDARIADIASVIPGLTRDREVQSFLLTSETRADEVVAHHRRTGTTTIQLVDALSAGTYADLRASLPEIRLVQVIHVRDERSVEEALVAAEHVDHLLLDSGNPSLAVKELGGTGRVHDWSISRRIAEQSRVPVYLAGGLNAANVRAAIEQVGPYGVDICSGVRSDGRLDPRKLDAFFSAVRAA